MKETGVRNSEKQMRQQQRAHASSRSLPVDSAEYVAERIQMAAQKEPEEQFMD